MAIFEASVLAALLAGRAVAQNCLAFSGEFTTGTNHACTNGADADAEATVGTTCTFECESGLFPQETGINYVCTQSLSDTQCDFEWVSSVEGGQICSAVTCPTLADAFGDESALVSPGQDGFNCVDGNGEMVDDTATAVDTVCSIDSCEAGYTLSGTAEDLDYTCTAAAPGSPDEGTSVGEWEESTEDSACVPEECPAPEDNGSGFGITVGELEVTVTCGPGADLTEAQEFGTVCTATCGNGKVIPDANSAEWTCNADGDWVNDNEPAACMDVACTSFADFVDGFVGTINADPPAAACEDENAPFDTHCAFECANGYESFDANADEFTCEADDTSSVGAWAGEECVPAVECLAADLPSDNVAAANIFGRDSAPINAGENGRFDYTAVLACGSTAALVGETQLRCTGEGEWEGDQECVQACLPRSDADNGIDIANGEVVSCTADTAEVAEGDNAPIGTVCTVACNSGNGFEDVGLQNVTCGDGGVWSSAPVCAAVQCASIEDDAKLLSATCNSENDECAFEQDGGLDSYPVSAACEIQACDGTLELENSVIYECQQAQDLSAVGEWVAVYEDYVCNEECSEAALVASGVYDPECCANRDGGCNVDYAGCNATSCAGGLVCGDAGVSCSPEIDALDVNATRCCVVEVVEPTTGNSTTAPTPDGTASAASELEARVITIAAVVVVAVSFIFV